ncbi:cytochrome c biogenesis protein CcdA [Sphaerisporangium sp. NPDC005289]|uniref:cytochrome c biogenesis CcdA family protein n=1 Tax=Sphaerisporangium sp. NPDC005289 TaxID=3155247 RepID=UPI0033AE32F0
MIAGLPLALALTAGLVAAFNPCGFAMLPAYLTLLITGDTSSPRRPVSRALVLSAAMSAGFVTVFGLFGLAVTPLALSVGRYLPWVTIIIGVLLLGLGGWLLAGRELLLRVPRLATGRPTTTSVVSLYGYGLSYAVASLSCTIGPFLAVVSASVASGGLPGGLAIFVAYALGMALVIALLSLTVALAHAAAVARLRRLLPYLSRISGVLLLPAGLYVIYYGWYELRIYSGAPSGDPLVHAAVTVQGTLSSWVETLGAGGIALMLTALILGASALRRIRRRKITRIR